MNEDTVNFVYWDNMVPMIREFWLNKQGFNFDNWLPANQEYARARNKIFHNWLRDLKPTEYYFFITTPEQESNIQILLTKYHLGKYLIWQSREYATNSNYPADGPRLMCRMFHIPKDYSYVEA